MRVLSKHHSSQVLYWTLPTTGVSVNQWGNYEGPHVSARREEAGRVSGELKAIGRDHTAFNLPERIREYERHLCSAAVHLLEAGCDLVTLASPGSELQLETNWLPASGSSEEVFGDMDIAARLAARAVTQETFCGNCPRLKCSEFLFKKRLPPHQHQECQ